MTMSTATPPVDTPTHPKHPLGSRAQVLLTSVFGPYARDDEYGSRALNPMELYHNQVTRVQGPFSLRMFHRSWGLMMIQANIDVPCTLLDFPTLDRFIEEISTKPYDVVGISAIIPNVTKVQKMCELIRKHLPKAAIVVGGHVANIPDLDRQVDADHIVRGDGIRWMRGFLRQDENAPIRHPNIISGYGGRAMGISLGDKKGDAAATLIPSVGCPIGCNFCATSAMFGGKGHCVHFFKTGDELFEVMCKLEREMNVCSFFVMDENFLLHKKRALRLLDLMIEHGKSWALYVFTAANVLRSYTIEQLVGLGVSWVWMGLEGKDSQYTKLHGTDPHGLVRMLQSHGIKVLGSSIIGLENHTADNIDEVIEYAVGYQTEFHQFMLYIPSPGTPFHAEYAAKGLLLDPDVCDPADIHGQLKFNYRHPHIKDGQEAEFIIRAFRRDFEVNGPSIVRVARTILSGWKKYKNHPDRRIRDRYKWEARNLAVSYAGMLWAVERYFRRRKNYVVTENISEILKGVHREFGLKSQLAAPIIGRILAFTVWREEKRIRNGWTYEPPTFYETNGIVPAAVTA